MVKGEIRHTEITVKERNKIRLDGVNNVASFDESYVTLDIPEGRISIEGQGLKIESLTREKGEIEITGKIDGVFYQKEGKAKSRLKGLFG